MINFVIIDDNLKTVNKLSTMLEDIFLKHNFNAQITCKTSDVDELLNHIANNKVDVLLLDIELHSYMTGLEIAELVRKTNKDCYIIFDTAHLEFGLVAYKFKTFDYISKPITLRRLDECIVRLFDDIFGSTKKFIKLDNKNTVIAEDEIKYIKKDGMKTIFHTDSRDYEVYTSFAKIQYMLSDNFVRCHKSFIVNINNVTKVEPVKNTIYFDGAFCDIGPKYKNDFLEVLNNFGNLK
jgi:DNA-binding LytR/AlgR family response regulator